MSSERATPAIELRDVEFAYQRTPVLRELDLAVGCGDAVAIIGPNGSGKSTLMGCVNGLLRPKAGRVGLLGRDVARLRAKEIAGIVAAVPQEFQIPFAYRVREIVSLGRSAYVGWLGSLREADQTAIDQAMLRTDTHQFQGREFNELSGGERQRVVIALALAQEPQVLLLDEPTAHLDLSHRIEVLRLVRAINRERGVTVLAALHDIDLAAMFFPRLVVLHQGRIVADGSPGEVVTPDLLWQVFQVEADVVADAVTGAPRVVPRVHPNGYS